MYPPSALIDHINAYALLVKDMEKCVSFYRDKLGFKLENRDGNDFAYFVFNDKGGPGLALANIEGASKVISESTIHPEITVPPRTYFAVFVENVDKQFHELQSRGVQFIKPPATFPWGQRIAYFEDPEGNLWEISHFIK